MHTYSKHLSKDTYAIFLFHGVIKEDNYAFRNSSRKHLQQDYFKSVLLDLLEHGNPVTMDEVVLINNLTVPLPKNAFVITFDDGFENNYSVAASILKELKIPATFYITTDFVSRNQMSWIDRIEYSVNQSNFSKGFKIDFLEFTRKWGKRKNLNVIKIAEAWLKDDLGIEEIWSSDDPLDKKMNWEQVEELGKDFIIGGHTHTHRIMSHLDKELLKDEILLSLLSIEQNLGCKQIIHYSYPEGQENHYNEEVIKQLKETGIVCCPTSIHGVNTIDTDLFHLKRIAVI